MAARKFRIRNSLLVPLLLAAIGCGIFSLIELRSEMQSARADFDVPIFFAVVASAGILMWGVLFSLCIVVDEHGVSSRFLGRSTRIDYHESVGLEPHRGGWRLRSQRENIDFDMVGFEGETILSFLKKHMPSTLAPVINFPIRIRPINRWLVTVGIICPLIILSGLCIAWRATEYLLMAAALTGLAWYILYSLPWEYEFTDMFVRVRYGLGHTVICQYADLQGISFPSTSPKDACKPALVLDFGSRKLRIMKEDVPGSAGMFQEKLKQAAGLSG